jgi:predicted DNA-binding ribbon-helix-helix protein
MQAKKIKGVPCDYADGLKKRRSINLTDAAWEILTAIASEQKISRSEVLERWIRQHHT